MTSRERILAVWRGRGGDRVPLTTWCFGFPAPPGRRWETGGVPRDHWYSLRGEHLHTLPQPWTIDDDIRRARTWLDIGIDDILDVSVPWSAAPGVSWTDSLETGAAGTIAVRAYRTPAGPLRHAVRRTGERQGPGWVVQPEAPPLFEDFNIPRAVEHAVAGPADIPAAAALFRPPDAAACAAFGRRMETVSAAAREMGVAVQAWAGFGLDAVVWLAGVEGAVLLAADEPAAFGRLMGAIAETDAARAELAASAGADAVVVRGWYSSTDFWSPALIDRHLVPYVRRMADAVHRAGRVLAYTVTTGIATIGPRLADAGVDVLYFVDPVQDGIALEKARDLLGGRMALAGGINTTMLGRSDGPAISEAVTRALDVLGSTGRFILHPVDALFPDTPWRSVEVVIDTWGRRR